MLWRNRRQVNGSRGVAGISKGLLAKNRLSDNVGGVKQFSSTRRHALEEERHFALADGLPFPTQARL